jgi:8-amino-7-oxononanoate synthase
MSSLDQFAAAKLAALSARSLKRELTQTARFPDAKVTRNGTPLISFSCNDYLNLSTHPEIIEAALNATRHYGAGAGGSRAVTGNHPLYAHLESRLAARKGTEAAIVFGSGYLANTGIIPALMSKPDIIFLDELSHACMWAGATLSGARIHPFPHNNLAALASLLTEHRPHHQHTLILTETVFSMDGDRANLTALTKLAATHNAWTMTDDAHGLGVIPPDPAANQIDLQMGTLSKAVGGYGGYLCASANIATLVRNRARSFVYTTGLPPATIAAAIAALDFMHREPDYCARPLANAQRFTQALGLPDAQSPIVPLIIGTAPAALAVSRDLEAAGYLVSAIRPPTVPEGTSRLRFTFTAAHTNADIDRLAAITQQTILAHASLAHASLAHASVAHA